MILDEVRHSKQKKDLAAESDSEDFIDDLDDENIDEEAEYEL